MAEKIIKKGELFESGLASDFNKELLETLELLERVKKVVKSDLKGTEDALRMIKPKDLEQLEEMNRLINKSAKEVKALTDIEKKELKVKEQLAKVQSGETKQLERYRQELREANKAVKAQIAIENELGITYENQEDLLDKLTTAQIKNVSSIEDAQAQNKALRLVVKQLNADIPEQAEAIQKLNGVIDENTNFISDNSDEFIQNKINIGNYRDSVIEAIDSVGLFSGQNEQLGQVLGGLTAFYDRISGKIDAFIAKQEAAGKSTKGLRKALLALGPVGAIAAVAGASIAAAFGTSQEKAIQLEIAIGKLKNVGLVAFESLGKAGGGLIKVFEGLAEKITNPFSSSTDISKGLDEITSSFDGFGAALDGSNDILERNIRLRFELQEQSRRQEVAIANLTKQEELLQSIADDSTASLLDQKEANKQLEEVAIKRLDSQISLASKARQIAENEIAIELARANIFGVSAKEAINNAELRDKLSTSSLDALKDATVAEIEAEKEKSLKIEEIRIRDAKIQQDLFEQNLDFLIDVTERNRNLLIQQFQDTEKNVDDRLTTFGRLNEQLSIDLKNQADEFEKLNEGLDFQININDDDIELLVNDTALATDNALLLNEQLQKLGLSEIEINRLKEVITDGKDAAKEIALLTKEFERLKNVTQGEKEGELGITSEELERTRQLNSEIQSILNNSEDFSASELDAAIEAINDKQEQLSEDIKKRQIDNRIETINNELELVENGSIASIQLEKEKNELLIEQQSIATSNAREELEKRIEDKENADNEEVEKEKEKQKRISELYEGLNEAAQAFGDAEEERSKRRLKAIDDEISAREKQQDVLRGLAAKGSEDAVKNLAFEQKQVAELERKRLKEEEKSKRLKLLLSGLDTYSSNIKAGSSPTKAIGETFKNLTLLTQFVNSLPSFDVGTDRVMSNDNLDGKGGMAAIIHPDEKILTAEQNKRIGYMSSEDLTRIGEMHLKGFNPSVQPTMQFNFTELTSKMDELIKVSSSNKAISYDFDSMTKTVTEIVREGNNIKSTKKKPKW